MPARLPHTLTRRNIDRTLDGYRRSIRSVGASLRGKQGLPLLTALKRERATVGPYPHVTLSEAANRIMTDLVILYGVRALLRDRVLPFHAYTVEYGHEDRNGFDLRAEHDGETLVGEAFNVSPSLYPLKRAATLRKLRTHGGHADVRLLLVNHDAMAKDYRPRLQSGEHLLRVNVTTGAVRACP